jgi:predicted phosphodiesterase
MRYAIISDIHSNYHALEACLKIIEDENIDIIACLGDIVGYNASPSKCVDSIRKNVKYCVMGNHDDYISGKGFCTLSEIRKWSEDAYEGLVYSKNKVSKKNKAWLAKLDARHIVAEEENLPFLIVHGSPWSSVFGDPYPYILNKNDGKIAYGSMRENHPPIRIAFFGHTHVPTFIRGVMLQGEYIDFELGIKNVFESSLNVGTSQRPVFDISQAEKEDAHYIFNPGAVGQPRDGGITCFIILDSGAMTVEYRPFEYDIVSAQKAIIEAGYSKNLAKRLVAT